METKSGKFLRIFRYQVRAVTEVKPLRPTSGCIALLGEVTVQGELGELEVANNG